MLLAKIKKVAKMGVTPGGLKGTHAGEFFFCFQHPNLFPPTAIIGHTAKLGPLGSEYIAPARE
jgi:hypothetical protein